ncbi:MAG TPA: RNA degradosome polyphosphate kinase [Egibacteraceae bacterium]|nr:RNA degradosome polyphosphate kinase [Egibacteraceae bacterium]
MSELETRGVVDRQVDGAPAALSPRAVGAPDVEAPELYLNRELSWLEFNRRVLAQATDSRVPLLERLRFVSIFSNNLDEFFMVRVAGLKRQVEAGVARRTPDGRTPAEQLRAISERVRPMIEGATDCLHDQLVPLLARHGLSVLSIAEVDAEDRDHLNRWFAQHVFPVLTPLAVDPGHPFPYISNLSLSLAVTVRDRETGQRHFARVKVPGVLPRFVPLASRRAYVPLEELITAQLDRLFPGMEIVESYAFRVTRNADLDLEEDEAEDLLLAIQQELRRRRFGAVVRLEVADAMPDRILAVLQDELGVDDLDVYRVSGLLALVDVDELADLDLPRLRWQPWTPVPHPRLVPDEESQPGDVFAEIRRGDLLLHHPFDSFTSTVERFITAASEDPDVLAIKQTLYRTSGDSPIVRALIRAAERGKQVVALVELKARFDEEANISWARALEKAGVHVVYGLVGLKTHTKTSLVVRSEGDGIRRYVHVGTGNYNPATARLYTDLGLLSCDPALGADVTDLFNFLTGYARQDTYRQLLIAPASLRDRIRQLIRREIEVHAGGQRDGMIRLKLNALLDPSLIAELYRASQAGVRIDLIVRGICALRPGVPDVSDRIRVTSVVGRLLEHGRIMQFGPDDFWIGSADWMPRNLDRRVEAMAPIRHPGLRDELRDVMDLMLADNVQAWTLHADGTWARRFPGDGDTPLDSQAELMRRARARCEAAGIDWSVPNPL